MQSDVGRVSPAQEILGPLLLSLKKGDSSTEVRLPHEQGQCLSCKSHMLLIISADTNSCFL